jgi:hypothetical protein
VTGKVAFSRRLLSHTSRFVIRSPPGDVVFCQNRTLATGKVALGHRLLAYTVVPSETTRPVAG